MPCVRLHLGHRFRLFSVLVVITGTATSLYPYTVFDVLVLHLHEIYIFFFYLGYAKKALSALHEIRNCADFGRCLDLSLKGERRSTAAVDQPNPRAF